MDINIPSSVNAKLSGFFTRGVEKVSVNEKGEFIFTLSDGSIQNIGACAIPSGGTADQILVKNSENNNDVSWKDNIPNYNNLTSKPLINGVELSGEKTLSDLGIDSLIKSYFISGMGKPTANTQAEFLSQLYCDTLNKKNYVCSSIEKGETKDTYSWSEIIKPEENYKLVNTVSITTQMNMTVSRNVTDNGENYAFKKILILGTCPYANADVTGSVKVYSGSNYVQTCVYNMISKSATTYWVCECEIKNGFIRAKGYDSQNLADNIIEGGYLTSYNNFNKYTSNGVLDKIEIFSSYTQAFPINSIIKIYGVK